MEYKISELVAKTNLPKSTILYYIREGLLPEAKKIKSNVHRYNDEHVELLRYIVYMKEQFGSSHEQIRYALQHKNQSFSTSFKMLEPLMNTLGDVPLHTKHYTKNEFVKKFAIDEKWIDTLINDKILMPLTDDDFTEKEGTLVQLILDFMKVGVSYDILKSYVHHAKALSLLEHQMQMELCATRTEKNFSTLWKIMFDTLFQAKDYIFKRHTYKILLNVLKDEIEK